MASQSGGSRDDDDDDYDDEISVPAPTIVRGNATGRYRNSSVTTTALPAVKEMASTNGGATTMNQSLLGRAAQLRVRADGGANRVYDDIPQLFPDQDPSEIFSKCNEWTLGFY